MMPACEAGAFLVEPQPHLEKRSRHGGQVSRLHQLILENSALLVEPPPFLLQRKLVRPPGIAPGSPPWQRSILLLNHSRTEKLSRPASTSRGRPLFDIRRRAFRWLPGTRHPGPRPGMKEQTPLQTTRWCLHPLESFHGGLSVFRAHLPRSPWNIGSGRGKSSHGSQEHCAWRTNMPMS